jgi:hypothetical protein
MSLTSDGPHVGAVVTGPLLPEPVEILSMTPLGSSVKLIRRGLKTNQVHTPVLCQEQLAESIVSPVQRSCDGDPELFRLGVKAQRLGLAYEYDPYFSGNSPQAKRRKLRWVHLHHSAKLRREDRDEIARGILLEAPEAEVSFVHVNEYNAYRLFDESPMGDGGYVRYDL